MLPDDRTKRQEKTSTGCREGQPGKQEKTIAQLPKIRPIAENSPNCRKFAQLSKIRPIAENSPNLVALVEALPATRASACPFSCHHL
jgi:hypothetical protein